MLSDFQVTVPELGTVVAQRQPFVVLTSNATRELSEALKRRCLFLHLDYPDLARERAILRAKVPEVPEQLADQIVRVAASLRGLELKKAPSIAEVLDWARTLLALSVDTVDGEVLRSHADRAAEVRRRRREGPQAPRRPPGPLPELDAGPITSRSSVRGRLTEAGGCDPPRHLGTRKT